MRTEPATTTKPQDRRAADADGQESDETAPDSPIRHAEVTNGPPIDPRKLPDDGLGQGPATRDRQVPQAGPEDDGWQVR